MDKDFILFDLDGTLTDPKLGITKSVQYSLRCFGIHIDNLDDLIPFIGPPLRDSYQNLYSFSNEEAEKAVQKYREYFSEQGIFENIIYDGIEIMLSNLYKNRKALIVATSKPFIFAKTILEHFKIDKYFSFISGSELDGRRSNKDLVIEYALENMRISDRNKAIMIGDRKHDIIGAKAASLDSIGVLYGYGDFLELSGAGATYLVKSVDELSKLLLHN